MWSITYSKQAARALLRMPRSWANRIRAKLKGVAKDPKTARNVKKLTDREDYRLRVGDWRVVYILDFDRKQITVVTIKPRGEAYKR